VSDSVRKHSFGSRNLLDGNILAECRGRCVTACGSSSPGLFSHRRELRQYGVLSRSGFPLAREWHGMGVLTKMAAASFG